MLSYLWGGSAKPEKKKENDNAEIAMREQLDEHGDFKVQVDGTLEFKDLLVFRSIVVRQANRHYQPQKEKFKAKQTELYKAKDQQGYTMNFAQAQKAYTDCQTFITRKACEWIDLDIKNFQLSMQTYMKDKEQAGQMQKREMEVREALNAETMKCDFSKEVAIEAFKFKIAEELVIARKMQSLQFTTNEQQRQSQIAIEYSKLSDKLNEKFGFELDQLSMALKKYDLGKNETIISFQKLA
jgi:hypothetical protein